MQKGISFVGLMDLGTLDALKKSAPVKIVSLPAQSSEKKIPSPAAQKNEAPNKTSSLSSPLDLQPC